MSDFEKKYPELSDRRLLIKWIKGKVADGHIDDIADTMLQQIHKQKVREAIEKCNVKDGVHGDTDDIIYPWALLKELGLE